MVDVTSTGTSTHLRERQLNSFHQPQRHHWALMSQAPGVRPNIDVGGSTINDVPVFKAFGQSGESYQLIEGLAAYSPKSGTQSGQFWDYGALEEARVETVGHDADVRTRGIYVNAIVKSGGNSFHGSGFWAQTGHQLQSNNISDSLAATGITKGNPIQNRYDVSGDLGGRIMQEQALRSTLPRVAAMTLQKLSTRTVPTVRRPLCLLARIFPPKSCPFNWIRPIESVDSLCGLGRTSGPG